MTEHISVLLTEAVELLNICSTGTYVDATLGRGGHSNLILTKLSSSGRLICFDQDADAISSAAQKWQADSRVTLVHSNFRYLRTELNKLNLSEVNGFIFDLGVSSPQLDQAQRGFSYQHSGILDMRMDQRQELTAYTVVNTFTESKLRDCIYKYGEERKAAKIARLICQARVEQPIQTTAALAEIVKRAFSRQERQRSHPARRTFQALRILVNDELGSLEEGLPQAIEMLKKAGRICVITFHSLEDRIVKQIFKKYSGQCTCPPGMPVCSCGRNSVIKTGPAVVPDEQEVVRNLRARSARLRWAVKL